MEAQAGAISTMSPAAAYVPQASTARSMTVSLSSGSMMVTGMSGKLGRQSRFHHRLLVFADDDGRFDGVCLVLDQVLESTAFGQTSGDPDHRLGREAGQRGACRMTVGGFGIVHKTNRAALDRGLSHGFDAMAARLERGKRLQRGIAISAKVPAPTPMPSMHRPPDAGTVSRPALPDA